MQTMSTAMATLLKSGKMIGSNRPTAEVVIGDSSNEVEDFVFGDTWVRPSTTYTFNSLSVAEKTNGKLIVCNVQNNVVMEGEAVDRDTLLTGDNGAINWVGTGITAVAYGWAAVFNIDGELYLNFSDRGTSGTAPARKLIYKSPSGNGGDWELYSIIQNWNWSGLATYGYSAELNEVGIPIKLDNGNWIMNNGYYFNYSGYLAHRIYIMISTDEGVTWSNRYAFSAYMMAGVYYKEFTRKIVKMNNGDLYASFTENAGTLDLTIIKSIDNGENWTIIYDESSFGKWPDNLFHDFQFFQVNDELFSVVYAGGSGLTLGSFVIMKWNKNNINESEIIVNLPITTASASAQDNPVVVNFGDGFILGIEQYLLGMFPVNNSLQPKVITINRSKGMAGGLTLEFDNKDAILAPDGETNPQLLWPNKEVIVKQGYGQELLKTFTGLIDSISMSRDEQGVASVTVSARDKLKVALDHLIRNQDFLYTLTYTNMLVEDIWKNLVGLAGLTYNTVEATGLTISEKTFSWETYADAFSWLDEIAGFETYCDEEGKLNFVWDGRPATVTTAYSFIEGVDITRLGYEINDVDLFYTVAVYGKSPEVLDVDGNVVTESSVIYFARQLPQASYWNIPSGKVLRIDAPDADTLAKCEIIADKAIYLMQTRARQVTFSTIGIPHLQRGDFIQVTESSSTISEIYRITDIRTQQGPDGYSMELTCYYHAAPEVV